VHLTVHNSSFTDISNVTYLPNQSNISVVITNHNAVILSSFFFFPFIYAFRSGNSNHCYQHT